MEWGLWEGVPRDLKPLPLTRCEQTESYTKTKSIKIVIGMTRQIWVLQIKSKEPSELLRAQHSMASKDWNSILCCIWDQTHSISLLSRMGRFSVFFILIFSWVLVVGRGRGSKEGGPDDRLSAHRLRFLEFFAYFSEIFSAFILLIWDSSRHSFYSQNFKGRSQKSVLGIFPK